MLEIEESIKKVENRNILFHVIIMVQFTLSKQGYLPNCLKNVTIPL